MENGVVVFRKHEVFFFSQMVSSLSSWLRAWFGQEQTVEWLLSGLLLLHLLVILFFVFSRGNASAFLQWSVHYLPELKPAISSGWSTEWCPPAAGDTWFHVFEKAFLYLTPYLVEGFSSEAFHALVGWTRARVKVKDGCRDTSRWTKSWVWQRSENGCGELRWTSIYMV